MPRRDFLWESWYLERIFLTLFSPYRGMINLFDLTEPSLLVKGSLWRDWLLLATCINVSGLDRKFAEFYCLNCNISNIFRDWNDACKDKIVESSFFSWILRVEDNQQHLIILDVISFSRIYFGLGQNVSPPPFSSP